MTDKKKLLQEFEDDFDSLKKKFKFAVTLEELEEFSMRDAILSADVVPEKLGSFILGRIIERYRDWHGYLNSLLLPNPSSYANQTEAKLFNNEEDKRRIWNMIKISMKMSSKYSLLNLDASEDKKILFIDEVSSVWKNDFRPGLIYLLENVSSGWEEK